MDEKDKAQLALVDAAATCPVGVYTHRSGGEYIVFAHSIDEETLTPLVHYFSLKKGTRWTRTVTNFVESSGDHLHPRRFVRVRNATAAELNAALYLEKQ